MLNAIGQEKYDFFWTKFYEYCGYCMGLPRSRTSPPTSLVLYMSVPYTVLTRTVRQSTTRPMRSGSPLWDSTCSV